MRKLDLTLKRFGRLIVIAEAPSRGNPKRTYWLCRCDCGNEVTVKTIELGCHVKSCGCLKEERAKLGNPKHGLCYTPEYRIWANMISRCYCPTASHFSHYGARGITVCERWLNSFKAFYEDMGPRPTPQHTLERLDNDGPYSPENCVWATKRAQAQNRRSNIYLTFDGKTMCVSEWARVLGTGVQTLFNRLRHGWPVEKALSTRPAAQLSGKLTAEMVKEIRSRVASGESRRTVAANFNVSVEMVREIVKRRVWKHV